MSLQKTSLPALLMFAGGWIATAGAVVVTAGAVVEAFLLLPPQPAARSTASEVAASPVIRVLGQFIVLPFRLLEPGASCTDLAGESYSSEAIPLRGTSSAPARSRAGSSRRRRGRPGRSRARTRALRCRAPSARSARPAGSACPAG